MYIRVYVCASNFDSLVRTIKRREEEEDEDEEEKEEKMREEMVERQSNGNVYIHSCSEFIVT